MSEERETLTQRWKRKAAKKKVKKAKTKFQKWKDKKQEGKDKHNKQKLITAIWTMTEMFELNEDDGTPITKETLKTKNLDELIDLFEEILEEAEKTV